MSLSLKKCKNEHCGKEFVSKQARHDFCCRKCFKTYYDMRNKRSEFPVFACQHCGKRTTLDFDPDKEKTKWTEYACPFCGTPKIQESDKDILTFMYNN